MAGYDRTTWKRLQRRMIVRRIGMPGRIASGAGKVGVVGDVSGSIDEDTLNLFAGHMAAIMDDARPAEVRVYWTDTRVRRVDVAKSGVDLRRIMSNPIPGGGGTSLVPAVYQAYDDGCDSVVVLTDGYCETKHELRRPTMWAITTHSIKSESGQTIHI